MTEPFRVEPAQAGPSRYWRGTGRLAGGRFPVPDSNLDVFLARVGMVGVDFAKLPFTRFAAHDSEFVRCDFTRTGFDKVSFGANTAGEKWNGRTWPPTVYRDCVFARTRFPAEAHFGNARFENCLFDASLRGLTFTHEAEFVGCTFRGDLEDVDFWGEPSGHTDALGRDRNAFTGNDFTGAKLSRVEFHDIDLSEQKMPA